MKRETRREEIIYLRKTGTKDLDFGSRGPRVEIVTRLIDFFRSLKGRARKESFFTYKGASKPGETKNNNDLYNNK